MFARVDGLVGTLYFNAALREEHGGIQLTLHLLTHRLWWIRTLKKLGLIEILATRRTAIVNNGFKFNLTWLDCLWVVHLEGLILCSVLHVQFWIFHFLDTGLLRFLFLIWIWSFFGILGACKLRSDIKIELTRLDFLVCLWPNVDESSFQFLGHGCLDSSPIIQCSIETRGDRVGRCFEGYSFSTGTNHCLIQIFRLFSVLSGLAFVLTG